jgi:hypothetical protein
VKLSKYHVYAFVRAVMNDVPNPINEETSQQIQAALVENMSPLCRELYGISPKAITFQYSYDYSRRNKRYYIGDADWKKITEPFDKQIRARKDFQDKLEQAALGCHTLKQLQEAFPDLTKYMPTEAAPTKNLPAIANLVQDLKALGWKS